MMRILVVALLALGALACFVGAWLAHARNTRELNRLGLVWRCERWPGEDNRSYHTRLRSRISNYWRAS